MHGILELLTLQSLYAADCPSVGPLSVGRIRTLHHVHADVVDRAIVQVRVRVRAKLWLKLLIPIGFDVPHGAQGQRNLEVSAICPALEQPPGCFVPLSDTHPWWHAAAPLSRADPPQRLPLPPRGRGMGTLLRRVVRALLRASSRSRRVWRLCVHDSRVLCTRPSENTTLYCCVHPAARFLYMQSLNTRELHVR